MANQKIKFNGTNENGETATVEIDVVNGSALTHIASYGSLAENAEIFHASRLEVSNSAEDIVIQLYNPLNPVNGKKIITIIDGSLRNYSGSAAIQYGIDKAPISLLSENPSWNLNGGSSVVASGEFRYDDVADITTTFPASVIDNHYVSNTNFKLSEFIPVPIILMPGQSFFIGYNVGSSVGFAGNLTWKEESTT